jgi:hypothetical protein
LCAAEVARLPGDLEHLFGPVDAHCEALAGGKSATSTSGQQTEQL